MVKSLSTDSDNDTSLALNIMTDHCPVLTPVACCLFPVVRCGCVVRCGGGCGSFVRLFVFACGHLLVCIGCWVLRAMPLCRCVVLCRVVSWRCLDVVVVCRCVLLSGEILGFVTDELPRKHLPKMFSLIKDEGLKIDISFIILWLVGMAVLSWWSDLSQCVFCICMFMFMFICIYMYISFSYMHINIHICISLFTHIFLYPYIYIFIHIYIYSSICTSIIYLFHIQHMKRFTSTSRENLSTAHENTNW